MKNLVRGLIAIYKLASVGAIVALVHLNGTTAP
jgi:hypothetical protein